MADEGKRKYFRRIVNPDLADKELKTFGISLNILTQREYMKMVHEQDKGQTLEPGACPNLFANGGGVIFWSEPAGTEPEAP